jgi:hypothetical protein
MTHALQSGAASAYVRWHFAVGSALLLMLSLVAFWDNLVSDVGQPSNADPKMVVHGLFLLAWVVLLTVQSSLPALGRLAWHRRIGPYGFAAAAGVAFSTLWLFVAVWRGWDALRPEVLANRMFLALFVLWMVGAWRTRTRPDWHKRFLYLGTLFLLEPVLAWTYDPLIAPFMPVYPPGEDEHLFLGYLVTSWLAFYAATLVYDRLKLGRFHRLTLVSLAANLAVQGVATVIAPA